MSISLVAGLGNPGREYGDTRHNLGWVMLDALAGKHGLAWQRVVAVRGGESPVGTLLPAGTRWLVKPLTFMNDSGRARSPRSRDFTSWRRLPSPRSTTISRSTSASSKSRSPAAPAATMASPACSSTLGDGFVRYRLGIGAEAARRRWTLSDFVLGKFSVPNKPNHLEPKTRNLTSWTASTCCISRGAEAGDEPAQPQRSKMNATKRNYRASFILDNRGKEESVEQIVDGVKKIIAEVQGEVTAFESIGQKDFARVTDRKLTGAASTCSVMFSAPAGAPAQLRERLRLNGSVYRTFIQISLNRRPRHSAPCPPSTKSCSWAT
jgi:small subunit ribosomal protein S6